VGRGRSTSGECVAPPPMVVAVAVLVMAVFAVLAVPAFGDDGGGLICGGSVRGCGGGASDGSG
jgi:hypothetical protein